MHLSDRVLNERVSVCAASKKKERKKKILSVSVTNVGFLSVAQLLTRQAREKDTSKEHLAPLAHIGGERWLSKQNNITCCETAPLYAEPH